MYCTVGAGVVCLGHHSAAVGVATNILPFIGPARTYTMRQMIEAQRRQATHPAVPSAPNTQMPQTRSGVIYNTQYGMASETGHMSAFGNMSPTTSAGGAACSRR